jgi:hypothetical protein
MCIMLKLSFAHKVFAELRVFFYFFMLKLSFNIQEHGILKRYEAFVHPPV